MSDAKIHLSSQSSIQTDVLNRTHRELKANSHQNDELDMDKQDAGETDLRKWKCIWPGCKTKPTGRPSDVLRHIKNKHCLKEKLPHPYKCGYKDRGDALKRHLDNRVCLRRAMKAASRAAAAAANEGPERQIAVRSK